MNRPIVEIDGSKIGVRSDGFVVSAGNSTIRGLAVNGFGGTAIVIAGASGNLVAGNFLGVDLSGATGKPNTIGLAIVASAHQHDRWFSDQRPERDLRQP